MSTHHDRTLLASIALLLAASSVGAQIPTRPSTGNVIPKPPAAPSGAQPTAPTTDAPSGKFRFTINGFTVKIGRASCRERV